MKTFIRPVSISETSMRINLLHKALINLGYTVADEEVKSHTAGNSTMEQVRALQKKLNIKYDEQYIVDQATYEAMREAMANEGYTDKSKTFVVSGTVVNGKGEKVKLQKLMAVDVDLKGAAKYKTVKTEKELLEEGFEFLLSRKSDVNGNYYIEFFEMQYQKAERKKADVVVYAVNNGGEIIGRSEMVNSEDYSSQGEIRNLSVIITKEDDRTEYEILMGTLTPFLQESNVKLIELSKSADQVQFLSGELDLSENNIQLAVDAETLIEQCLERAQNNKETSEKEKKSINAKYQDSSKNIAHELLYGIGQQQIILDWLVLYKKTAGELLNAIQQSMEQKIIRKYEDKIITAVLEGIHQCAAHCILTYQNADKAPTLQNLLSVALPESAQQTAFVDAYRNFKNSLPKEEIIDYKKFWQEYLPSQEIFKERPELISSLLLSQQLIVLGGNHQPLVEELQVNRKITAASDLVTLEEDDWKEIIKKTGVPGFVDGNNEEEKAANYVSQVQALINAAYPTQKIADMLGKQELPVKNAAISKGIKTFLLQNNKFEIGQTPVHEFAEELKSVTKENYTEAKNELNRMQRVFQVSPSPKTMAALMEKNMNSAYSITSYSKKNFIKMHSGLLGGDALAEAVYQRAEHISTLAAERAMKMYDLSHLSAPAYAYSESDRKEVVDLLQKQVSKRHNPNYSEIFGSPDICECEQCRSVYGAAAYLVDLLRFLEKGGVNADGKSPLQMFNLRRPDLLYLPLTCENTNTLIPYIDLVNEVMEYYTANGTMPNTASDTAAYNTGDTTADELRANPQNFVLDAYKKLKDAVYPFNLPYHQPLDVIRTYSNHLKTERYEVMHEMQKDFSAPATRAIEAEALRISQEEFLVLTGKKYDLTPDTKLLHEYFGYTIAGDLEKMAGTGVTDGIHEFLRRAGVTYTDLVEIIKTKFINPYQKLLDHLQELFLNSSLKAPDIYTKLQQINAGVLNSAADPDIPNVLNQWNTKHPAASVTSNDFDLWVRKNFNDFSTVITLYQSNSLCDLNTTYLKTIQNIYSGSATSGITNGTWSKMHRFIRLWRKLGWTLHETDLVLAALGETDITEVTISKLCYLVNLNKQLKLPLNKLATIWGNIDTYGDKSLYKKLFLNKSVQKIDDSFDADEFGNYLSDATIVLRDTSLVPPVDHTPAVLAAFRMSEDDLNAILEVARVNDNGVVRAINLATDKLNIFNLSIIYRYTVLSKALKLKVPEFCLLVKLFNAEPFSTLSIPAPAIPAPDPTFTNISPSATQDFYNLLTDIKKSGFKGEVLQYIFTGDLPAESKTGLDTDKAKQSIRDIREALAAIEQNYPLITTTPLTADLLQSNLLLTYNADVVNQMIGIIGSQQTFRVITDTGLAAIVIPGPLNTRYSYNPGSGELKSAGIMPDADRLSLKGLAGATVNFQNAVDSLYSLTKTPLPGAPLYTVVTDLNLPVIIPDSLSPKFIYTKGSGRLTCTGVMSDNENAELKALAGVNANFQSAVDEIYKMPEVFIRTNFSGVFASVNAGTPNSDFINLLNHPSQPVEQSINNKLQFVYSNYLPLLKQKLREDATVQHIASLIGLSNEATQLIIRSQLQSLIDSIAREGFSGEYFSDVNWTTSVLKRTDNEINFDWGANAPDVALPANNFSIRWQNYFAPPSSGEYTLIVEVQEADETFNLYLDNELILKKTGADVGTSWEKIVQLNASKLHKFIIEYTETTGNAGITLSWKTSTNGVAIIPSSVSYPATTVEGFISTARIYQRAAKFLAGFKLTETEINHLLHFNADFGNIDFKLLTAIHWQRINDYFQLRNKIPQSRALLTDVFAAANINSPGVVSTSTTALNIGIGTKNLTVRTGLQYVNGQLLVIANSATNYMQGTLVSYNSATGAMTINVTFTTGFGTFNLWNIKPDYLISLLNLATAWDINTITDFIKNYFVLTVNDFKNEIALVKIYKAISFVLKTGLSSQTISQWAAPETDFNKLHTTADLVKTTVKAKYEEEDWMKLAGDLSDKIRENQKQALISYLLTKQELIDWGVTDADGLFEYFLIDVQMGACMDTSRIVQANGAVQMFVNRCLFNLESHKDAGGNEHGVAPEYIDKKRWGWMEYYRVWEVNRKIFITPENWLEPEWRDDKSQFFKELESELTQNDITDRTVETAFRNYLTKLNAVANLDICGMYQENNWDGSMKLLHVFGRTHNAPYQFFYRTCSSTFKWGAWKKVQLDVRVTEDGDKSGVHLMPVVWKSRLFLFWIEFIEKQEETKLTNKGGGDQTFEEISKNAPSSIKPRKYYEIRLAWSEYFDNKWSAKQLTKEFIKSPYDSVIANFSLVHDVLSNNAMIIWLQDKVAGFGNYEIDDIQSQIYGWSYAGSASFNIINASYSEFFMKVARNSSLEFNGLTYLQKSTPHTILFSTHVFDFEKTLKYPFFYQSYNKTYFVRPFDTRIWDYFQTPETLAPIAIQLTENNYEAPKKPVLGPDDYYNDVKLTNPIVNNTPYRADKMVTSVKTQINSLAKAKTNPNQGSTEKLELSEAKINVAYSQSNLEGKSYLNKSFSEIIDKIHYPNRYFRQVKGLEFHTFYHPFSSQYVTNLNNFGIDGLMNTDTFLNAWQQPFFHDYGAVFTSNYDPNFWQGLVKQANPFDFYEAGKPYTYYQENICFDLYGANSLYNWELFFHAPLYIATRLSKNGRYEEAKKWFHYIFDPTTDELQGLYPSETSRYWKVFPFKLTPKQSIEQWFASIAGIDEDHNGENDVIQEWRDNPFKPFLVARNRPLAFMKNVVIKYVENLREWGDSLFRVFQREQVYEALQLYVMANHILGPRPEFVPKRGEIKVESYDSLKGKWDDFSNALVELENIFPYSSSVPVSSGSSTPSLLGMGSSLYFCIPSNEKLMEHWDTIADRLYKIRHCMDIDGVKRQLALFAPPIDPAMLINAAAQGLSLGSILSDLSSPPPIYRFTYLIQKANEFVSEVKSLGGNLLSVLEKKDGEELGRLRASHETMMLDLMTAIKERQVLDANAVKGGLLKSRDSARFRLNHYNSLLSSENIEVPDVPDIDSNVNSESQLPADTRLNEITTGTDTSLVDSGESGVKLIQKEKTELDLNLASMVVQEIATAVEGIAGTMNFIPTISGNVEPFGCGVSISYGGSNIAGGMSGLAKIPQGVGQLLSYMATQSAKMASYIRREQEWTLQANLAAKEIIQLDKQIISADIKIQISEKELLNHKQQIENSKQVEQFLKDKFTNQELYQWLKEQLFSVYKQSFNVAYDMAKKVEKCYQYELGIEPTNFIQYGYWDNTMQGLCAGEKLQLALRQLEKSYIEENKRELELTKNVSMGWLNPLALEELRATGKCFLTVPEEVYDLDYQGHYFRRIKSISISVPCIAGPYTTINCSLRLLKNSVRINTSMNDSGTYEHNNDEGVWTDDDRFRESNVPVKAIATSTAQRDSGMFELNFRDERYLPFEGAGAISGWKIELTQDADLRLFDYSTISDIIMHVSYTAREDAGSFKDNAVTHLKEFITNVADLSIQPLLRMFSLKHEFSTEWYKFLNPTIAGSDQVLSLSLRKEHFPFFSKNRTINVKKVQVLMKTNRSGDYKMILTITDIASPALPAPPIILTSAEIKMPENLTYDNMQMTTLTADSAATANINVEDMDVFKEWTLKFKHNSDADYHSIDIAPKPEEISDLFVVFHYSLGDIV